MSREIKFRVWVKKQKKIMHPEYIWWENQRFENKEFAIKELSLWETPGSYEKFGNLFKSDEVVVMQYTGLKDKNGVEIYEGDILQIVGGRVAAVEWISASWGYRNCMYPERDEVIGNIYENPELLK